MAQDATLLLVEIPQTNDKKELSAEQMFAAIHAILKPKKSLFRDDHHMQDRVSFEITSIGQRIRFFIYVPGHLRTFIEEKVYEQYPTAHISTASDDYSERPLQQMVIYSTELVLTDSDTLPIKTFPSFEIDPLAAITTTLAKLNNAAEEMWLQILVRPVDDMWHKKSAKMVQRISNGAGKWSASTAGLSYLGQALGAIVKPPESSIKENTHELTEREKTRISAIEEKSRKLGYQVKIRILYAGNDETIARQRMQSLVGTFKQYNTANLNGFQSKYPSFDRMKVQDYSNRSFSDRGYILNIEELASIFHLPHTSIETPNIAWATTKTAEPPNNLPTYGTARESEISLFGITNFRSGNEMFGALRSDRGKHICIAGQSGSGKSGMLELLSLSDIYYKQGLAIIDPHGDYAINILRCIPKDRMGDVIYFNPKDSEFPIGFNPLEVSDPSTKGQACTELVGILKNLFESWGPRLEYILRYSILALLDYPQATLLDITRLIKDEEFRNKVILYIQDPLVKNFWNTEYKSWNEKFATDTIMPLLQTVEAFTAHPLLRNIFGQPKNAINFRQAIDDGKIIIANLSLGLIGENNTAVLGALLISRIQQAAMHSPEAAKNEHKRPFYLYIDEFQIFASDSFSKLFRDTHSYNLNVTIANQTLYQMNETVRKTVLENIDTKICFRLGHKDSKILKKYFAPQFGVTDLSQLHDRHFVITMHINGEKSVAFSATTLNIPEITNDQSLIESIASSRSKYATSKQQVEATLHAIVTKDTVITTAKPTTLHNSPQYLSLRNQISIADTPQQPERISTPSQTARAIGTHATRTHQPRIATTKNRLNTTGKLSDAQKQRLRRHKQTAGRQAIASSRNITKNSPNTPQNHKGQKSTNDNPTELRIR